MPLTPEQLEALALKPATVTGDEGSVTQRSADDLLKLLAAAEVAEIPVNANGGALSGWRGLRPAVAVTQGTYG